jgi:hypothetical protein
LVLITEKKEKNMQKRFIMLGSALLALAVTGCDNLLTGNHDGDTGDRHNSGTPNNTANTVLASIRSAVYDPASDCAIEGVHTHNGVSYSGHYNNDGHGHQGLQADTVCVITGCEQTGLHEHSETHYAGHAGDDSCNHHGNGHHGQAS